MNEDRIGMWAILLTFLILPGLVFAHYGLEGVRPVVSFFCAGVFLLTAGAILWAEETLRDD